MMAYKEKEYEEIFTLANAKKEKDRGGSFFGIFNGGKKQRI